MKTLILNYQCCFDVPAEIAYDFHTDVKNLPRITPPWIKVAVVSQEKNRVVLDITQHFLTLRWEIDIALDKEHLCITDSARKAPLPYFVHERRFYPSDADTCVMHERIELRLPFGLLGYLFYPLVRHEMNRMFAFRHRATQAYFELLTASAPSSITTAFSTS